MSTCLFCQIAEKALPAEFVYENEVLFVLKDLHPQAPIHFLIIPKIHILNLFELTPQHQSLIAEIHFIAGQLAKDHGLSDSGCRLVNNCLPDAGQSVPHLHFHLLGGRKMTWPPS